MKGFCTTLIDRTMAGKPFKVGRFAHTLRMRLMREHLGVDVDAIEEDQLMAREPLADGDEIETWDPDHEQDDSGVGEGITSVKRRSARNRLAATVGSGLSSSEPILLMQMKLRPVTKGVSENVQDRVLAAADHVIHPIATAKEGQVPLQPGNGDKSERQDYDKEGNETQGFASSVVSTLEEKAIHERRPSTSNLKGKPLFDLLEEGELASDSDAPPEATVPSRIKEENETLGNGEIAGNKRREPRIRGDPNDKELFGAPANRMENDDAPPNHDTPRSDDSEDQRHGTQARQTLRKHLASKPDGSPWSMPTPTPKINPNRFHDPLDDKFWNDMWVATAVHNTEIFRKVFRCLPDDLVTTWASYKAFANHAEKFNRTPEDVAPPGHSEPTKVVHDGPGTHGAGGGGSGGGAIGQGKDGEPTSPETPPIGGGARDPISDRTPSGPNDPWAQWERDDMEKLLQEVRGHLGESPKLLVWAVSKAYAQCCTRQGSWSKKTLLGNFCSR